MNLSFKREIDGKPTYFPEKIIAGLDLPDYKKCTLHDLMAEVVQPIAEQFVAGSCNPDFNHAPKLHTIRENKKGTWKPGVMIDFIFWSGRPYHSSPVKFAPRIPVVSTQKIEIRNCNDSYYDGTGYLQTIPVVINGECVGFKNYWKVFIDGRRLTANEINTLAKNDGFDTIQDFFKWFGKDFSGAIIHWTDLKY